MKERNAALEETERKESFPSKCNKRKGRENLSMHVVQRFQSKLNEFNELNELAEENVKTSLFKKVLNLSPLNCYKWSVVS